MNNGDNGEGAADSAAAATATATAAEAHGDGGKAPLQHMDSGAVLTHDEGRRASMDNAAGAAAAGSGGSAAGEDDESASGDDEESDEGSDEDDMDATDTKPKLKLEPGALEARKSGLSDTPTTFPEKNKADTIIRWLKENYEPAPLASLPRVVLYDHYCEYCDNHHIARLNTAGFGRLLRQTFPNLKTRRLGNRGNSKYFYQGLRVQASSPLSKRQDVINTMRTGERLVLSRRKMHMTTVASGVPIKIQKPDLHSRPLARPLMPVNAAGNAGAAAAQSGSNAMSMSFSSSPAPLATKAHPIIVGPPSTAAASTIPAPVPAASSSAPSFNTNPTHQRPQPATAIQPRPPMQASAPPVRKSSTEPTSGRPPPIIDEATIEWPRFQHAMDVTNVRLPVSLQHLLDDISMHMQNILKLVNDRKLVSASGAIKCFWVDRRSELLLPPQYSEDFACFARDSYIVLFSVVLSKLLPNLLQPLSMEEIKETRDFALLLETVAIDLYREVRMPLQSILYETVKAFSQALRRGVFLNHVTQAAATVLADEKQLEQMRDDWSTIDWGVISDQVALICNVPWSILSLCGTQVGALLELKPSANSNIVQWVDMLQVIASRCLMQPDSVSTERVGQSNREFLMKWTYIASLLIRDFAVRSAGSFGSFQLMRLFADECLQAIVDQHYTAVRFQLYSPGTMRMIHPSLLMLLESSNCLTPPAPTVRPTPFAYVAPSQHHDFAPPRFSATPSDYNPFESTTSFDALAAVASASSAQMHRKSPKVEHQQQAGMLRGSVLVPSQQPYGHSTS